MNVTNTNVSNAHLRIDYRHQTAENTENKMGYFTKKIHTVSNAHIRLSGPPKETNQQEIKNNIFSLKETTNKKTNGVIYSPFYNEDMVIQAIGINSGRIIKGKNPFPVICAQENSGVLKTAVEDFKNKELSGRLNSAEKIEKVITSRIKTSNEENGDNALNLRGIFDHYPKEVKTVGEFIAIKKLEIIRPNALKKGEIDTIYMIGHGEAGSPHFFETSDQASRKKTISKAASEMTALLAGKVKNAVKIKVTSCESADRETIESVYEIPKGISDKKRGVAPLALTVKEEVSKDFPDARFFGYHGIGVIRGYDYIGETRCAKSDFDEKTGKLSNFIKASLVRKEF